MTKMKPTKYKYMLETANYDCSVESQPFHCKGLNYGKY